MPSDPHHFQLPYHTFSPSSWPGPSLVAPPGQLRKRKYAYLTFLLQIFKETRLNGEAKSGRKSIRIISNTLNPSMVVQLTKFVIYSLVFFSCRARRNCKFTSLILYVVSDQEFVLMKSKGGLGRTN